MWWDSINQGINATANMMGSIFGIVKGVKDIENAEDNAKFQKQVHEENLQFQKEKLAWDQNLQGQIFAREDNAVQRRVADLKAAGINPIFAAGSSAGAGSVVPTVAPHGDGSGMNQATANRLHAGQMIMNALKMRSEIDHTRADTRRLNAEARWIDERREGEVAGIGLDNEAKSINNAILELDKQLKQNEVKNIDVNNAILNIEKEISGYNRDVARFGVESKKIDLDIRDIEYLAKVVALNQAKHNLTEEQRDAYIRRAVGLMRDLPSGMTGQFLSWLIGAVPSAILSGEYLPYRTREGFDSLPERR